jgi:septum site-determining protein MinD
MADQSKHRNLSVQERESVFMSKAKVLVVTSGKGGVGKTTSTAALGAAMAQAGQNVVVVDFDVGLRNLDLVLGVERRIVYDLTDVVHTSPNFPNP